MFSSKKNILKRNEFKTKLDDKDKSLIILGLWLGINVRNHGFFDLNVYDEYVKELPERLHGLIITQSSECLYGKISDKYNHHEIFLQWLVKRLQSKELFVNSLKEKILRNYFHIISQKYVDQNRSQEFEEYCKIFIKPEWKTCFTFYSWYGSSFSIVFHPDYLNFVKSHFKGNNNSNQQKRQSSPDSSIILNHFQVLGIPYTKDVSTIKQAYRKLVLIHHPDKGGSNEKFIKITDSYNYIINHL